MLAPRPRVVDIRSRMACIGQVRLAYLRSMATTKREFSVIIERDADGYYVALVPELKGCHTQAKSLDTLMKRVREAIELCLEVEGEQPGMPEFVGVQRIAV
jgi:predicted RNase H-like HicB family nuclease